MKTITTASVDSSLDATLNPVELGSKEIVAWGIAFPRPARATPFAGPHAWRLTSVEGRKKA
jgi:hypothetical protein